MLGSLTDVADRVAGLAEGLRVHDGADVAIFAQVFAEPFVAETAVTIAACAFLLELMHQDVERLRDVCQDPTEDYRTTVPDTKTQTRP